jgi:taurine transport system permease protein
MIPLFIYVTMFVASYFIVTKLQGAKDNDYTSRKTVTFGDESAVKSNFAASMISVIAIFVLWCMFTGSVLIPGFMHMPAPFQGSTSFEYTVANGNDRDTATVSVLVHDRREKPTAPSVEGGEGFAKNDSATVASFRTVVINVWKNDEVSKKDGSKVIEIDGKPIQIGSPVTVADGVVKLTDKATPMFEPSKGLQMQDLYLPSPEAVFWRTVKIAQEGFRGTTLLGHLGWSLYRVIAGFICGALVGIPLGYAMGLNGWFRGWFDPIVEVMRPVPPLALIPLVILWFGIWENGKVVLLFLAALWIMAIAARSGVSGVNIAKVHAAYSLGASKAQIMRYVIIPNSLPEIFTGARVAMGVCWGTVVAAELVAAEKGAGMMIMVAAKFQFSDIVVMGIIMIGVIGFGIDMLMRQAEKMLVPWKGKG